MLKKAQDLEELLYPKIAHVADNLPEVMQYLDLVRDACSDLDVPMIPVNVVEHQVGTDPRHRFKAEDDRLMQNARLYKTKEEYEDARKKRNLKNKGGGLEQMVTVIGEGAETSMEAGAGEDVETSMETGIDEGLEISMGVDIGEDLNTPTEKSIE
ncbi:hypothetical protein AOQ84DRAFT_79117 [Glonium stellatum]|uniref:Uncharacterized protein n=1 Tax=Glonium stellatum TaxID=574774 RepID=A0A8E2FB31_9PEZI|nr:hypothetical protein AOQ84DRAFT_79117 [Glonium stellatum]